MSWQDRDGAPFGQDVWDEIDAVARGAADEVRAERRLLEVVGPLGFSARAGVAEAAHDLDTARPRAWVRLLFER